MVRPLLPKEEGDEVRPDLDDRLDTKAGKRRCVSSACTPCRKRKSKCDGGKPSCSTCTAVYQTECDYDVDSDHRRKGALKKDIADLQERNDNLTTIIASLGGSSESDVILLGQRIRSDERLEVIAASLRRTNSTWTLSAAGTPEADLADVLGQPSLIQCDETRQYRHTSGLGIVPTVSAPALQAGNNSESWTTVTQDTEFVGHLLGLYFSWQHPFYAVLSKECFLHDMSRGQRKYCSPVLVNALLAAACCYSDRPEARAEPDRPVTAGNHFFLEAKRLLDREDHSCMTTVQALSVLSVREASCGRESSGYRLIGRAMRMSVEMGLHRTLPSQVLDLFTPTEIEVRRITFWGCFSLDTSWAIGVGRISQLPTAAINLGPVTIVDQIESTAWRPFVDDGGDGPVADQHENINQLLLSFSELSKVVNDLLFMFYAPAERFTSRKLLDFYSRYERWERDLPPCLSLADKPTAHVINLHMYYHTVVLHLFRPFLRVGLHDSTAQPREVCRQSTERISDLVEMYRTLYGFRRVCIVMTHCILSAMIIHLLSLPSPSAARLLIQAAQALRDQSVAHEHAARCLRIVAALAEKWGILVPEAVDHICQAAVAEHDSTSSPPILGVAPSNGSSMPPDPNSDPGLGEMDLPSVAPAMPTEFPCPGEMFGQPFTPPGISLVVDYDFWPMETMAAVAD
ncbi:MAG: hypothetical protein M1817_003973 [Caeruleum heppii]|nr:MAG: hypothetical protein M1817_003973 [Caeruleum heppii]